MTALAAKNLLVGVAVAQIVHLGERRCLVIDTSIATRADISSDDEVVWMKGRLSTPQAMYISLVILILY